MANNERPWYLQLPTKELSKTETKYRQQHGIPLDLQTPPELELLGQQGSNIRNNNTRLQFVGSEPTTRPEPKTPWWQNTLQGVGRVFDWIDRYTGARAIRTGVRNAVGNAKGHQYRDVLGGMKDSFKAGSDAVAGSDILSEAGMGNGWGKSALGFGLDLLLDPTTYLAGGSIIKKGLSEGAEAGAKRAIKGAVSKTLEHGTDNALMSAKNAYMKVMRNIDDNLVTGATKKGTYKMANKPLQKAEKAYEEAIEGIQNKFKTNQLRAGELSDAELKNLEGLADNIGKAEQLDGKELFKRLQMKKSAGLASDKAYKTYNKLGKMAGFEEMAGNMEKSFPELLNPTSKNAFKIPSMSKGGTRTLDSEIFKPKGDITASIGKAQPKMQKGIVFNIPFTKINKMLLPLNKLPSEMVYDVAKKMPIVGRGLGILHDLTAYNKPSNWVMENMPDKVGEFERIGKTLSTAESMRAGKAMELDNYINKTFAKLTPENSMKIINFTEKGGGGSQLYDQVTSELLRHSGRMPLNEFANTDAGKKIIHNVVSAVDKAMDADTANHWWHVSDLNKLFAGSEPEHGLLDNYITHLLPKEQWGDAETALTQAQRAQRMGSTANVYMKSRENPLSTVSQLIAAGLNPETDLKKILAVRGRSSIKSQEMQKFWKEVQNSSLVKAPETVTKKLKDGKTITKVIPAEEGGDMVKMIFPEMGGYTVNQKLARTLMQWLDPILTHQNVVQRAMTKAQDVAPMRMWKKAVTSWNPKYHLNNTVDNVGKVLLSSRSGTGSGIDSIRALSNPNAQIKINGKLVSADDIKQAFNRLGGSHSGSFLGDLPEINTPSLGNAIKQGVKKLNPSELGEATEQQAKMWIFIDRLKKGFSPEQAMADANKYLFNYKEISPAMRAGRAVFPFLTWRSKNIPLMMSQLFDNPMYVNASRKAIENAYAGTGTSKEELPDYALESSYMPVGRTPEGKVNALPIGLAANDLNMIGNPSKIPSELFGMVSPLLKVPLETMVFNKPAFMNREFKTPQEKMEYAQKSLLGAPRTWMTNYQEASKNIGGEDRLPTPVQTFGLMKQFDPTKVQIGRNYDYIDKQNQDIATVKNQGTAIPTMAQINDMVKGARGEYTMPASAVSKMDFSNPQTLMQTEARMYDILTSVNPALKADPRTQRAVKRAIEILKNMPRGASVNNLSDLTDLIDDIQN